MVITNEKERKKERGGGEERERENYIIAVFYRYTINISKILRLLENKKIIKNLFYVCINN